MRRAGLGALLLALLLRCEGRVGRPDEPPRKRPRWRARITKECPQVTALNLPVRPQKAGEDNSDNDRIVPGCDSMPDDLCGNYLQGGLVDAIDDWHSLKKRTKGFTMLTDALLRGEGKLNGESRFGDAELVTISPAYVFAKASKRTRGPPRCGRLNQLLHPDDEDAWNMLGKLGLSRLTRCPHTGPRICDCNQVACWRSQTKAGRRDDCPVEVVRVVALLLGYSDRVTERDRHKYHKAVRHLGMFEELRVLSLWHMSDVTVLGEIPSLITLQLGPQDALPKQIPRSVEWLSILHEQREVLQEPSYFEPVCKLRRLRVLQTMVGATGIPPCIGSLTELMVLDFRGGFFGDAKPGRPPLPPELSNLKKLVVFVAFEHGLDEFHSCPEDPDCVPSYETILEPSLEQKKFRCPNRKAWSEDLMDLPIFDWPEMQKFWVDANGLSASPGFFARAARAWPKLRSLDLYNNNFSSDIAELIHFAGHTSLEQVLLHHNNFSGVFPADMLNGTTPLRNLNLQLNPHVEGCVSEQSPALHALFARGTRIRTSSNCNDAEGEL